MGIIQKYLIYVLVAALVIIGGLYLWQRITVVKQKAEINTLTVTKAELEGQIADAKANVAAAKKSQKEQQKIANDAAILLAKVGNINPTKCLEAKDEKTISDITYFFNSRGLLIADSDPKAGGEVLPAAGKADADRPDPLAPIRNGGLLTGLEASASKAGPGWTTRQIVENYLTVIDYTLKLEKTVSCYELP
jgi:hypothetical protein